jgi:type I restriction enzyme S subunit
MSHYKPYPTYKDSGVEWIGRVPEHWRLRKVAWDLRMTIGWTPPTGQQRFYGGQHNWVAISDLSAKRIAETKTKITDAAIAEKGAKPAPAGSLLFSYKLTVGEVALLDQPAYTNEAIAAFHPAQTVAMEWWRYAAPEVLPRNGRENIYGALLLNQELMADTRFYAPDTAEQSAIAAALDRETARIDALIAKKTRFIELLKEKRQALITDAVTKGLDPNVRMKDSGVAWIGEVPEHWTSVPIRRVAKLESGHTPSRSVPEYWVNCTIPWFTLADVWQVRKEGRVVVYDTAEKVSELGVANSSARKLPAGTVILSRTASVGFPAIMGCEMATSQDFAAWVCGDRLFNEFLYLSLAAMREELGRLTMGSTHKTIYASFEFRVGGGQNRPESGTVV